MLVNFSPGINAAAGYFRAWNPTVGAPRLVIQQGTWGKKGPVDPDDTYIDKRMSEGQQVFVDGFREDRLKDSNSHKKFAINALD